MLIIFMDYLCNTNIYTIEISQPFCSLTVLFGIDNSCIGLPDFMLVKSRGDQYVHCVMHKCIMVKQEGEKKNTKYVKNT